MQLRRKYAVLLLAFVLSWQTLGMPLAGTEPSAHAEIGEQNTLGTIIDEWTRTIAPGVTETSLMLDGTAGRQSAFVMDIDPSNPNIHLQAGMPNKSEFGMQTVRQQASHVSKPGHIIEIGAVNADFYNMSNGIPLGAVIQDGRVLKPGTSESFGIKASGEGIIGYPNPSLSFKTAGAQQAIDGINMPRRANQLIAYTADQQTTKTDSNGTEVLVEGITEDIRHIGQASGRVAKVIHNEGNQPIREGEIVLSGSGAAADFLDTLTPGESIELRTSVAKGWEDVEQALGGNILLMKNGTKTPIQENSFTAAKAPRTAVGIREDSSIFFVVIDGRQPGYAEGITIFELQNVMHELGAKDALNLDGGGSSTFASRTPGEAALSVKNIPSDGKERPVANSFFVVSTAKESALSQLAVQPDHTLMLAGSTKSFTAKGMDSGYNPVKLETEPEWSVNDRSLGTMDENGQFTAGSVSASGRITADANGAKGDASIAVTDQLSELKLSQQALTVKRGEKVQLKASAFLKGRAVHANADDFRWKASGNIGSIDRHGVFQAADQMVSGTITVQYGGVSDTMDVQVGKLPVVLETFEEGLDQWTSSGARYNSATIRQTTYPEPARFGNHALQLDYDFTGTIGTSGAYAHTKEDIEIEGYPEKIGMWVYGDGAGHWLRAQMRDSNGNAFALDFTPAMDWKGWKYVEAAVPAGKATPLKLDLAVRLMETKNDNKNAGTIYIDNIRAVYGETNDDLLNPELSQEFPSNHEVLATNELKIAVTAKDNEGGTGINPKRTYLELDGKKVDAVFDEKTGVLSYVPEEPLLDGYHQVKAVTQDRFGNESEKTWQFEIDSGHAGVKPVFTENAYVGSPYPIQLTGSQLQNVSRLKLEYAFDPKQLNAEPALQLNEAIPASHIVRNEIDADGRVYLEIKDLHTIPRIDRIEEIGVIPLETAMDAKDGLTVEFVEGQLQLTGKQAPISVFMPSIQANVKAHLSMDIDRASVGFPSKIKVKNEAGDPVKDATIQVVPAGKDLAKVKAKEVNMYAEADSSSKVIVKLAKHDYAVVLEKKGGWLLVKRGGQTGWIRASQATVEPWQLGTTDRKGEVKTDKLALVPGELIIQASKGSHYSYQTKVQVLKHLGTHKPERTNITFAGKEKAMNITWTTSPATTASIVELVPSDQYTRTGFSGKKVRRIKGHSEPHPFDAGEIQVHYAAISGLKAKEAYTYRVGDGTEQGWSKPAEFTAAAKQEEAFSFILMGDTQAPPDQTENGFGIFTELLKQSKKDDPDAAFMMHVGDMIDDGNLYSHWNAFFESMKEQNLAASTPIVPAVGNHENIGNGVETYKKLFRMPQNGPEEFKGTVYSFDYGSAHFAVLNTETTKEGLKTQARWLKEDMARSKKQWKIVVFHRAPYYSNPQGGSGSVREVLPEAIDEAGIDLVISGHDHAYVRTFPLKNGKKAADGTTYIIAGSTGKKFYPATPQSYMDQYFDEKTQVYTNVAISSRGIRLFAKARDGRIIDDFTISK
ncbi:phosphodiester glycosidase family protein [Bacillus xiapuensis]|uniref:phosphodiester glycosidase family protein n=1 Tax=Bacillus xiapuensis TaxID=2014075 RepID=UPI0018E1DA36|nr:phosphodiester glycosidase family protein [Bacillus xiapuensis]